jgi:hypothetical protein
MGGKSMMILHRSTRSNLKKATPAEAVEYLEKAWKQALSEGDCSSPRAMIERSDLLAIQAAFREDKLLEGFEDHPWLKEALAG